MSDASIYADIAQRTGGAVMVGVVGPVRTGKSTFIKRFMETMVIPNIDNEYSRERARDELPQSGSGRTIMTSEPKFVPEEAVNMTIDGEVQLSVRLVDCVGYMVDGAAGQFENGEERLVATPWAENEISMSEAAELGTHKVITEHSTIGIVVTTDGSICGIEREKYLPAEERVIRELKDIGKPFAVIVNSTSPLSREAAETAETIRRRHGVPCLCLDCLNMDEADIRKVMRAVLEDFPIESVGFFLPDWLQALPESNALKSEVYADIIESFSSVCRFRDLEKALASISEKEVISGAERSAGAFGEGKSYVTLMLPRELYYRSISEETGVEIRNDGELFSALSEMSAVKGEYDRIREALQSVREKGYGVVLPDMDQMQLEEPKIVRQGGKYSVRLKANAPAIHLMMTNIETEVTPAIGGETASEDIINFLLQGFDGDINRIWQSNIFGKSLYDIACESLTNKICSLSDNARSKLQHTLERIINEGSAGLICILL